MTDLDVGSTDRGTPLHVDVTARGPVASELAGAAARRVSELQRVTTAPLLHARVVLTQERNPRIELPARAEGELLVAGRPIRARVAAPAMRAAIDALAQRLHDQLRRHVEQIITEKRQPVTVPPGQWRHRAWTPPRPPHSWRPAGERDLVRRKTCALEPTTAREAAADMAAPDHRFYLFQDVDTGADAVVYERADGRLAVIQPADAPAPAGARDCRASQAATRPSPSCGPRSPRWTPSTTASCTSRTPLPAAAASCISVTTATMG